MNERVEQRYQDLQGILEQARIRPLAEAEYQQLAAALQTLNFLTQELENRRTTIGRLRGMLFGTRTEKTRRVFPSPATPPAGTGGAGPPPADDPKPKPKGHGRKAADAYRGATRITFPHASLKLGDRCPSCRRGKVYARPPAVLVRLLGGPPVTATVYERESLRCNLCLEIFTAPLPETVPEDKYDPSAAAMIALLKYGSGFPFHRLEQLQAGLGIPLPASTQWGIVERAAGLLQPVWQELVGSAAQGQVLHNDDTTVTILDRLPKVHRNGPGEDDPSDHPPPERTGRFTSGIVSIGEGRQMALFFTGHQHAGENLGDVLARRAASLEPPIQMCDALSRNVSSDFQVVLAHCLAHARRRFVEVAANFPQECRSVLETFRRVYENEALTRQAGMSPEQRLAYHQAQSGPLLEELRTWSEAQLAERKVEPNSGLGKALLYIRKHWSRLTLFLQVGGAPIDNNLCERALKHVILHRKNSLFYKTLNGAEVGDLFMSLIHTCRLNGADPFHYLTTLQQHARQITKHPHRWMPWNYRETLRVLPTECAA